MISLSPHVRPGSQLRQWTQEERKATHKQQQIMYSISLMRIAFFSTAEKTILLNSPAWMGYISLKRGLRGLCAV